MGKSLPQSERKVRIICLIEYSVPECERFVGLQTLRLMLVIVGGQTGTAQYAAGLKVQKATNLPDDFRNEMARLSRVGLSLLPLGGGADGKAPLLRSWAGPKLPLGRVLAPLYRSGSLVYGVRLDGLAVVDHGLASFLEGVGLFLQGFAVVKKILAFGLYSLAIFHEISLGSQSTR